jgi:choline dehydrogenase-like flavoprotein
MNHSTDVLIIGSGPAGAAVADTLLKSPRQPSVLMLEAGRPVPMGDERKWWDFLLRNKEVPYKDRGDYESDFRCGGSQKMDLKGSRLFAVGGTSLHWGAWMPRFQPEDFRLRSSAGIGMDWPISYNEIEPYYCKAEHFSQVAGDSTEKRPWRSRPFLFEAPPFNVSDGVVIRALCKLGFGYSHYPVCRNRESIEYRDPRSGTPYTAKKCESYGTCKYCPVEARYSSDQTVKRLLEWYPQQFKVLTGASARKILMSNKRKACALEYFDDSLQQLRRIEFSKLIIAAGAIESPKLLLASRSRNWPQGIGNDSRHVGRNITAHLVITAIGVRPSNPEQAFNEVNFPTLACRHFDSEQEQPNGKMLIYREHSLPTVDFAGHMKNGKSLNELSGALKGAHAFELDGFVEEFSHCASRVGLANGFTRFGTYRTEIVYHEHEKTRVSAERHLCTLARILDCMGCCSIEKKPLPRRADHLMSSCRMSRYDRDGVVDENLCVHGTDNIFVCSNAVYTSGAAANPSLTLVALAIRLGEHLLAAVHTVRPSPRSF